MDLHEAARNGSVVNVTQLISGGVDPNCRDRLARTPLHVAAFAGQQEAVATLLALGANSRLCAGDDTTALHFAAQKGHVNVVGLLLKQGVKIDTRTRKGMTSLHLASLYDRLEVVKFLLSRKANPKVENRKNQTPRDLAKSKEVQEELEKALASGDFEGKEKKNKKRGLQQVEEEGGEDKRLKAKEEGNEEKVSFIGPELPPGALEKGGDDDKGGNVVGKSKESLEDAEGADDD